MAILLRRIIINLYSMSLYSPIPLRILIFIRCLTQNNTYWSTNECGAFSVLVCGKSAAYCVTEEENNHPWLRLETIRIHSLIKYTGKR